MATLHNSYPLSAVLSNFSFFFICIKNTGWYTDTVKFNLAARQLKRFRTFILLKFRASFPTAQQTQS